MKNQPKILALFLSSLSFLMLVTPAHSTTLIEFILSGQAAPYLVTDHDQCNKTPVNKSMINKKSLNPLCEICISLQSQGLSSSYFSIPNSALSGNPSDTASYSLCGVSSGTLGDAFVSDFSLLCSTRGGTVTGTGSDSSVVCSLVAGQ